MSSRKETIADAIVTALRGILLSGAIVEEIVTPPEGEEGLPIITYRPRVYRLFRLEDAGVNCKFPCFAVYTAGIAETNPRSGSATEDIGYGIGVALLAPGDTIENQAAWEEWREAMQDLFRNRRLGGVSQVVRCVLENGPGLSDASPIYAMIRGNDVVRCIYQAARSN